MPRMIHVLRKPLSEGTVASNVLKHGTGGLNIDASRISFRSEADERESKTKNQHGDLERPVTPFCMGTTAGFLTRTTPPPVDGLRT